MMNALATPYAPARHRARHSRSAAPTFRHPELTTVGDRDARIRRIHGLQRGRMVEVRIQQDDHDEVGSASWVLAAASPAFDVRLGTWSELPAWLAPLMGDLPLAMPVWQGLRLYSSQWGLVAVREGEPPVAQAYLHDLWLLHRIADSLGLLPLPAGNLAEEPIPAPPISGHRGTSLS